MRGDAEDAGAALTVLGAGFFFAVAAGLLVLGHLSPTTANLYVALASGLGLVAALGALLATTDRLPALDGQRVNAAAMSTIAAAFAASAAPPADEWVFRELFLLASVLLFLGGVGLLGSAVVEWRRADGSASA